MLFQTAAGARRFKRIENALWGLFIGDALAMPVHGYYDPANIAKDFGAGGVQGYEEPKHPHPEAFVVGMSYSPDVRAAEEHGRKYDILGPQAARLYRTTYAKRHDGSKLSRDDGEAQPNPGPGPSATTAGDVEGEERHHYHDGLKAGENTLGLRLVSVLMQSVLRAGGSGKYDALHFVHDFVEFMTTPRPSDPYTEPYILRWFENYCKGKDPVSACADHQTHCWTVGSMGGMLRPLVLSLLCESPYQGIGVAVEHQALTHRSPTVASAVALLVPLVDALTRGSPVQEAWFSTAAQVRLPDVTGEQLFQEYLSSPGPGNVIEDGMRRVRSGFSDERLNLQQWVDGAKSDQDATKRLTTACPVEHGLPLLLILGARHNFSFREALIANANLGGDCVHRGALLGFLLGAASDEIPDDLKRGLVSYERLQREIEALARTAVAGHAV
jgi:ADP-ribosyl-[dinitrogen reductase] hydrolase